LEERKSAGFPPFMFQVLLSAEAKQEGKAMVFLKSARGMAVQLKSPVEVYSVIPAAMPKRANHYRAQLLVQADTRRALQDFLRLWKPLLDAIQTKQIRWSLDVDPLEF
jgi:primosomal protein N' (replication factor Y)